MATDTSLHWISPYWVASPSDESFTFVHVLNPYAFDANVKVRWRAQTGEVLGDDPNKSVTVAARSSAVFLNNGDFEKHTWGWLSIDSDVPVLPSGVVNQVWQDQEQWVPMTFGRWEWNLDIDVPSQPPLP